MTDDAGRQSYTKILIKTDVLDGAKYMSFAEGVEEGLIRFVGDDEHFMMQSNPVRFVRDCVRQPDQNWYTAH